MSFELMCQQLKPACVVTVNKRYITRCKMWFMFVLIHLCYQVLIAENCINKHLQMYVINQLLYTAYQWG